MKICPICQQENSSAASFCRACGNAFTAVEQASQTILLSDSATDPPIVKEIEKIEKIEKRVEIVETKAEPPLLLPPSIPDVQTGELSLPTPPTETKKLEVETGPLLELDPVLPPLLESETDEQNDVTDTLPVLTVSRQEEHRESEPKTGEESLSASDLSANTTNTVTPAEPVHDETVEPSEYSAPPTIALPSLLNEQPSSPATIKLPAETEGNQPKTVPETLIPDQEQEASEILPQGQESGQNDETAPIPTVTMAAPSTGKLPPMPPERLLAGDLVAQRYKIIEWLSEDEGVNLYLAKDLYACGVCGFDENPVDDQFCWDCGVDRTDGEGGRCELRESDLNEMTEEADLEAGFIYNDLFYLPIIKEVEAQVEPLPNPLADPTRRTNMTFSVGYASHVGMIRRLNEDSLSIFTLAGVYESISEPSLGLFIVADGLGGHDGGEFASKFVVETIADRLIRRVLLPKFNRQPLHPDAIMPRVEEAVFYANEQLYNLAEERLNDMGCTLTMALVIGQQAYIANVGDSRTYIYRDRDLRQVTQDHSLIASLISAGIAQPHEIYTHPERNVIYRSMGHAPNVEVDLWQEELIRGAQLLLCSDGLWEPIHNEGIIEVLRTDSALQAACDEMVHRANVAGGEDNITIILVKLD